MAADNKGFELNENGKVREAVSLDDMPRLPVVDPQELAPISGEPQVESKSNKVTKFLKKQCYMRHNIFLTLLGAVLFLVLSWTLLFLVLKKEVLPSGDLFRLIVLVIVAYIVGIGFTFIKLPALLGMLLTGLVLKYVKFFYIGEVYQNIVVISRNVALTVILAKAGLGLDAKALRKLKFMVIKLAIIPCCAEAIAGAVFSHFLLGFPWVWAFLLGFLLSPISPAVVVPTLLSLKERGYGEDKGISTLVIAASSIDDIFSISAFGIFLSAIFNGGDDLAMEIAHAPLEIIAGLGIGIAWGLVAACFPHRNDPYVVAKRTAMVALGGLCLVLGSNEVGYSGSGPLACITSSFVAAISWKIQGWDEDKPSPVANIFSGFWTVMQPILFSLIGTEINVRSLDGEIVGKGIAIVLLSLIVRIIVCFLSLIGGKLNLREIIFVNFSWLPKATVQAALSAQAHDHLTKEKDPNKDELGYASTMITIAVLAIIITAPVGAVAIALSGPHLLNKKQQISNISPS